MLKKIKRKISKKKIAIKAQSIQTPKQRWEKRFNYFLILIILVCAGGILYVVNPTFQHNLNGFASTFKNWNDIAWENIKDLKKMTDSETVQNSSNTIIKAEILTCDECDTAAVEEYLNAEFSSNIYFSKYDFKSKEGIYLTKKFNIRSVPMVIFDQNLKTTGFYEKFKGILQIFENNYLLYGPPTIFVKLPDTNGTYFKGEGNDIIIYTFLSFSDPLSKIAAFNLDKAIKENSNVKAYFKYFIRDEKDLLPANAVECAGSQGIFWPVYNAILDNQDKLIQHIEDLLPSFKNIRGLDLDSLKKCVEDRTYQTKIDRDDKEAEDLGIDSSPSFIINGYEKRDIYTYENFIEIFSRLLSKHKIDELSPSFGDSSAKITLIEYTDYECPFSAKYAKEILPQIKAKYSDKIYYVKKDFPLRTIYKNSFDAAKAARCANEQEKFWEMYESLYSNQAAWYSAQNPIIKFDELAEDLNLDVNLFNKCINQSATANLVKNDFETGKIIGVNATPTIFIESNKGAQKVEGLLSLKDFERLLDKIIDESNE